MVGSDVECKCRKKEESIERSKGQDEVKVKQKEGEVQ